MELYNRVQQITIRVQQITIRVQQITISARAYGCTKNQETIKESKWSPHPCITGVVARQCCFLCIRSRISFQCSFCNMNAVGMCEKGED